MRAKNANTQLKQLDLGIQGLDARRSGDISSKNKLIDFKKASRELKDKRRAEIHAEAVRIEEED